MIIIGGIIILRSLGEEWFFNSLLVGGAIFIFGVYKVKLVIRYLRDRDVH